MYELHSLFGVELDNRKFMHCKVKGSVRKRSWFISRYDGDIHLSSVRTVSVPVDIRTWYLLNLLHGAEYYLKS